MAGEVTIGEVTIHDIGGLNYECRNGTSDYNVVRSCSLEDEYGVADIEMTGKLVFDIGAHIGGFAVWQAVRGATVVAVEPVPENAQAIRRNAKLNDVHVHLVEAAIAEEGVYSIPIRYGFLGDETAEVNYWVGNTGLMLSGYESEKKVNASVVTFTRLVERFGAPDVVKTDCEGGEWAMFQEPAFLRVPLITGEWHDRAKGYMKDDEWVETVSGFYQWDVLHYLAPTHEVAFFGPDNAAGGFRAVLK